jgi:DNA polymerase-3 subunit alpha
MYNKYKGGKIMLQRFETHSHTHYSNIRLLDSINRPELLIKHAQEIGLAGIAITDHEVLSSHMEVNILAKKLREENPEFKIALGNEIYLTDTRENGIRYWHFILIAKDKEGHRQLRELSSLAWLNSYWDRGLERVPTLKSDLEEIVKKNPGHLIATSACIGGELSGSVLIMEKARQVGDLKTAEDAKNNIIRFVLWCKELFGEDFYIECAPGGSREQIIVNKKLVEMAPQFGVKMVIGTDAHYLTKEDRYVHKAYLNSKGGEREVDDFYEYAYLQDDKDIYNNLLPSIADSIPTMYENSMEIYNKIEFYDLTHPQVIPSVEVKDYPKVVNQCFDNNFPILSSMMYSEDKYERYWVNECINKLKEKDLYNDEYLSRLEEEADVKRTIGEKLGTNMFSYPITLQHYINMFWDCGSTVGAGRGSSCSGLNHYLLGVTQLDPIKWDLPFWRYLNKERVELGDIDLDLCPSKRPLIIQKIKEERGKNFRKDINEISKKNLGCTLVATFGTESAKSTILTACRGYRSEDYPDGIDNDIAQYMSSLVPQERGFIWPIHDMIYGNEEKDRQPIPAFINEVNQYPGLLDIMQGIEGLISRRGSHASGVIMFDEDPYEFGCFMKTPSGDVITQYDLHMAEAAGMTKYDFLLTEVQDKIAQCIKFLQESGEIEDYYTLREVYDKYFHPDVLDINDKEVWENIQQGKILNIFQFDSPVGAQAAKKIKPSTMLELSDANGLMRLMTSEKGAETPMEKYIRFKNNLNLWYREMKDAGLTEAEIKYVEPYFKDSYGVPPSQEQLMRMLMDENICHFSLKDANAARKIVGKKQMSKIPALKEQVLEQASSPALGQYVWRCGIGPQMGYSFSIIHALAYSFIGYQTAYLATKWNPIYWDTACLVVNSGSLTEDEDEFEFDDDDNVKKKEKGTDYSKIAKAIGDITEKGIEVSLVNINTSELGFKPDIENNRILYGLKALSNISADTVEKIKVGRPYEGIKDFMNRCPLTKTAMINLIKAGAFDEVEKTLSNRKEIMAYYINKVSEPKKKLTLQNWSGLVNHNLVPKELELQIRVYNFTKYLKASCKVKEYYQLNDICMQFLQKFLPDTLDKLENINGVFYINQGVWDKIYQAQMDPARDWLKDKQEETLNSYNQLLFKELWDKYASGTMSHWEMEALCFYHGEHELKDVNVYKYNLADFNELKSNEVDYYYNRHGVQLPVFKLYRIIGTVIAKDDNKHTVILLTTTGVVSVKFTRDYYSMFKKQISQVQADGSKKVIEKSWFKRGTMLMITGYRRDDQFVAKTYTNSQTHQLYKITMVDGEDIKLQHERMTSEGTIEEEYDE